MIPYDTKNYRASNNMLYSNRTWKVLASIVGVLMIAWMIKLDREILIDQIIQHAYYEQNVIITQCTDY